MALLKDIVGLEGKQAEFKGWAFNVRSSGKIAFVQFRDGTGRIQGVVVKDEVSDDVWEQAQKITIESSLRMAGTVKKEPRSPYGYEMQVTDLEVIQEAEEYPIGKKEHGPDFLLDNRHLWLRSSRQWAIQRIRSQAIYAICDFFRERGFIKADTPIFTPTCCEGTTELFKVPYFDEEAYLAQSGQLYLEAVIMAHGRAFDFGPAFRAEKSKTRRHLTEFWMMDAEAAFMEHEENMQLQEDLIKHMTGAVLERSEEDLKLLERNTAPLRKAAGGGFARMTYGEALERLKKLGSNVEYGHDLGGDDETVLSKEFDKPLFIEKYPAKAKAFYMQPDPDDDELVLNNDLLAPEGYGEIIGGSQRIHDYDLMRSRMKDHGLSEEEYGWYLDLRKYGSVPHSGFGLGLERTVTWICGIKHLRESIPFPRLINRLRP